jgi:hypothetical protein
VVRKRCILAADPYSDRRDPSQTRNLGTPHRCSKVMGPCSLGNEIHCMGSAVGTSGWILVTTVLGNGIDRDEWLSTVEAVYENAPGTGRAHSCSYGANSSRESGFLHKKSVRTGTPHSSMASILVNHILIDSFYCVKPRCGLAMGREN